MLLYRICGSSDICIGTPVVGRPHADLENQIGCYINLIVLRNDIQGKASCISHLQAIQTNTTEAYSHKLYPFDRLVNELAAPRKPNQNPIFDVMVTLLEDQREHYEMKGFRLIPHPINSNVGRYELTFGFEEIGDTIQLNIEYMSDLFAEDTVEKIGFCFLELLQSGLDNPDIAIDDLNLIPSFDLEQIGRFNNTRREWPKVESILPLLEQQYQSAPAGPMCVYDERVVTGHTLHTRANRIASALIHKFKVQPEEVVGILAGRNDGMIAGLLGIMKSGAAYLPIQPDYPESRIRFIVEKSRCRLILTENRFQEKLRDLQVTAIALDDLGDTADDFQPALISRSQLAYVLYTSGSTGQPKGVMVEHGGLLNTLLWFTNTYRLGRDSRVLLMTEYSFDVSVEEIFGTLIAGATLYIPPKEVLFNKHLFLDYLKRHRITIAQFVPATLQHLLADDEKIPSLDTVICGGEALPEDLKNRILIAGYKLYNHYGPTECTVDVDRSVVIGNPIANMQAHILDGRKHPMPLNISGELHLSGSGVARGYLNDPELTAVKFFANPADLGQRLYATGDRARWRPDGTVEFLGRLDRQIKLRGGRIEPEEIVGTLCRHPSIRQAVVIDRSHDSVETVLVAYLVPVTSDATVPGTQIREFLNGYLPSYMVPSLYVWLDSIPLNDNGKCDYAGLPMPLRETRATASTDPLTDIQKTLIEVLGSVLGNQTIEIHDNYFELGGDSIRAIQVISRLYMCGLTLEIADIFNCPTILELSTRVKAVGLSASQETVSGAVPLGPIQSWYLKNFEDGGRRYNQSIILLSETRLLEEHIRTAFAALITHHDQLRASFRLDRNTSQVEQYVPFSTGPIEVSVHNLTRSEHPLEAIEAYADDLHASISIRQPPLLRISIFRCAEGDYLSVIIHHLVVDGISWRIIIEDLMTAYNQSLQNKPVSLPPKSYSFRDWAKYQHDFSRSSELLDQEIYWHDLIYSKYERLPPDFKSPSNNYADAAFLTSRLAPCHTDDLLKKTHHAYQVGMDAVLLVGLSAALKTVWNLSRAMIMLESHGRDKLRGSPDVSRTVGWFTCRYPFVLNYDGKAIHERIRAVHAALRGVPENGIGYGILDFLTPPELRRLSGFKPDAQIEFNYLGQVDADVPSDHFRIARIPLGRGIDPAATRPVDMEINCIVVEGRLEIVLTYNRYQFLEKTVLHFLDAYVTELIQIAEDSATCSRLVEPPVVMSTGALSREEYERLMEAHSSWRGNVQSISRLSPTQEGMLFHTVLQPDASIYYDQMTMTLTGNVSLDIFQRTWGFLLERHDMLRTRFIHADVSRPVQITLARSDIGNCLEYHDLCGLDISLQESLFQQAKQKDELRGFNLSEDVLIRINLFQIDAARYHLLISNHHIILDGWSAGTLFREFTHIYHSLASSRDVALPALSPYAAYVDWIADNTGDEQRNYWKAYLEGYSHPAGLPFRRSPSGGMITKVHAEIDSSLTSQLIGLSNEKKVTIFTIIQAIWGILLGKYNEADDVVFGVVASIRPPEIEGIEHSLGLYVNTIPVRLHGFSEFTFDELIAHIQANALLSWHHQHFPLYEILKSTSLREKLFDHLLIFENYPITDSCTHDAQERNFQISEVDIFERANYDLVVEVSPGSRLRFTLGYDSAVYKKTDMEGLLSHILNLTQDILDGPRTRKIRELSLLDTESANELRSRIAEEQAFFSQLGEMNFE
jgi:amino acid adenylation domain-containing protein/non-ribosomal peptide synthase protein (TIGR01720 family)